MRILLLALILFSSPASAWNEDDSRREWNYLALHVMDWGQTLDISQHCEATTRRTEVRYDGISAQKGGVRIEREPEWRTITLYDPPRYLESNPFLGACPDRGDVNRYFLLTGILHYGIARTLPPNWRYWFQHITISNQANTLEANVIFGLEIRF